MRVNDIFTLKTGARMWWDGHDCGILERIDTTDENPRKWMLHMADDRGGWYWCDWELWTTAPPEESVTVEVGPVTIKVKLRTVGGNQ